MTFVFFFDAELSAARARLLATLQAIADATPSAPPADRPRKRRRGPAPMPVEEQRRHRVSVYLNDAELAELLSWVFPGQQVDPSWLGVRRELGRYMRDATFERLPPVIPAINREAWIELSRVAGNLNRYQVAIEQGHALGMPPDLVADLRQQVQSLRRELLGLRDQEQPEEPEHQEDAEG